jgi:hypothetical protein
MTDETARQQAEAAWRAETDERHRLSNFSGDDWMIDREDFVAGYLAGADAGAQAVRDLQADLGALRQRVEGLERALRSWAKSQDEPAGELCWCSEGEALSAMRPADHATACIRAREALRPADSR